MSATAQKLGGRMGRESGDPQGGVGVNKAVASSGLPSEVDIEHLSRNIRIINRAEKGPKAGKPFIGAWDGNTYPDGADADDPSTWLQPGEHMDVPREAALHLCGNLWDGKLPDKRAVIEFYGGYEYADAGPVSGRVTTMQIVGPPRMPDLVAMEVNGKGKATGEPRSMWDLYKPDDVLRK